MKSIPAATFSSSADRNAPVPGGGVPTLSLPGSRFAMAIRSVTVRAGNAVLAISTIGVVEINPIGVKSRRGS